MVNLFPHLSTTTKQELSGIVDRIKSVAQPEKIILFGSYAKGKNVQDQYNKGETTYEYVSDYDILVLYKETEKEYFEIEDQILRTYEYKAPLSLIILHIDVVNNQLAHGDYFFSEIINEGIVLFDAGTTELVTPKKLTDREKKEKVKANFQFYFDNGCEFLELAKTSLANSTASGKKPNLAAYLLHQATEAFYSMLLLVYSGYKPKAHNLDKFRKLIKQLAIEITEVFPIEEEDKNELYLFDLLKRSYIAGKYKREFEVSYNEVEELVVRLTKLKEVSYDLCKAKIVTL
ncbi:hypothetical protein [Rufibacter sp. LB8]|uniref:hypothetical protein n=1 Tax=Rufibacter sp. LB8 TaxID=2777781 RepID=UPI00178C2972|nr:hypothetical protein [Rufibacter sp. LB8]